ncbi:hypothetical protein Mapa_015394 [Marchantia paleacea]|nr:hypothetical protein Mapa_015394 [Marchantia paleacea]
MCYHSPCFIVRDGVGSCKNPTTLAGVPATILHSSERETVSTTMEIGILLRTVSTRKSITT